MGGIGFLYGDGIRKVSGKHDDGMCAEVKSQSATISSIGWGDILQ